MNSALPTVSVIVLTERGSNYLRSTINSILEQTYADFEILIFSSDRHLGNSWFTKQPEPRLKFMFQGSLGLATTLNQGILAAKGKYLSFISAGDLWHPQKLAQQILELEFHPEVGLVHTPIILLPTQGQVQAKNTSFAQQNHYWLPRKILASLKTLFPPSEILAQNQICLSSVMVRRRCFDLVGRFEPQSGAIADWEMWIRLRKQEQFIAIAEPLVYCRQYFAVVPQNWLTLEQNLHTIIETAYANLSPELERQKHRSYSYANLFLACNHLKTKNPDPAIVRNYWYQALAHDLGVLFTPEFCQLRWAIFRLDCQQSEFYDHLWQTFKTMENFSFRIIDKIRDFSHSLLNWLLEEHPKVKQQGKD